MCEQGNSTHYNIIIITRLTKKAIATKGGACNIIDIVSLRLLPHLSFFLLCSFVRSWQQDRLVSWTKST